MALLCRLTGHALPYRCGDCRGFCIEQVAMTVETLAKTMRDPEAPPPGSLSRSTMRRRRAAARETS
jgi:hypothetical protein